MDLAVSVRRTVVQVKTVDENGEYTNLEMYLNSLVQDIMDKCREGGTVVE